MGEAGLEFKKFEKTKAKQQRVQRTAAKEERVPAASAETLRSQQAAPGKRPAEDEDAGEKSSEGKGKGKGKDKDGMSVKERTRLKRMKGQSGVDHNGKMCKPEVWMKIRQEFD